MLRLGFGFRFWPTLIFAKRKIKHLAKKRGIDLLWVTWIGAVGIDPIHLAIWIATEKDWERDQLRQDASFEVDCRDALLQAGYPSAAVPFAGIEVESQQRVDRDCAGQWRLAMQ